MIHNDEELFYVRFLPCLAVILRKASIPPAPIGLEAGSNPLVGSKLDCGAME